MINNVSFTVYKSSFVIKNNLIVPRQFIVLKHGDGSVEFTNYHRYISSYNRVRRFTDDGNNRFAFVAQLLNYVHFHRNLSRFDDITVPMIKDFLNAYGMGELPNDTEETTRSKGTVKRCVIAIMDFMEAYVKAPETQCKIKKDNLYEYVNKRDQYGKVIKMKVPVFEVNYNSVNTRPIFRDIPNKAFDILFTHIATHHTELLGLVMNSAFAGLRPGESCNVRREDSPLGPGIIFYSVDGEIKKIEIDLLEERKLRSDSTSVGRIKKERIQVVPDIFLDAYINAYKIYTEYLAGKKYEEDYGPFNVNSRGLAMTYDSYKKKFQAIVRNELVPIYLQHDNPEVVLFGRLLIENNLSPHVFRHWFTVQLVLSGVECNMLQAYRGDTSAESSLTYINGKGEIEKMYRQASNKVFDYLNWAAAKLKRHGK